MVHIIKLSTEASEGGDQTVTGSVKTEQVNMKGIQRHVTKYRVQKRINGQLQMWAFDTLDKAIRKRDAIFAKVAAE